MKAGALKLGATSVLVVDDDPLMVRALARHFRAEGLIVYTAHCGQDGVRELADKQPDILVVDLFLPDIDGVTVCQVACQLPRRPVIMFISGQSDAGHRVRALEAGADDFMVKPVEFDELRMRIALRQRGRSGTRPVSDGARRASGAVDLARTARHLELGQQARGRGHILLIDTNSRDLKCLDDVLRARGFASRASPGFPADFRGPEVVWLRQGPDAQAQVDELRSRGYSGSILVAGPSGGSVPQDLPGLAYVRFPCRICEIDEAIVRALPEGRRVALGAERHRSWLGEDIHGIRAALTKTEDLLFGRLLAAKGALVERHELTRTVLGVRVKADASIDRHASTLRTKLELFCLGLVTHRGRGYSIPW